MKTAKDKVTVKVRAGEVTDALAKYFTSEVSVSASDCDASVDNAIYAHWWSQGSCVTTANKLSDRVSRGLQTGRLEIVYHRTKSRYTCLAYAAKHTHGYDVVTEYDAKLSSADMVLHDSADLTLQARQSEGHNKGGSSVFMILSRIARIVVAAEYFSQTWEWS